jgi:hypothetical protein
LAAANAFIRRIRIHDFFTHISPYPSDSDFDQRFKVPSIWLPPRNTVAANSLCRWVNNFIHGSLQRPRLISPDSIYSRLKSLSSNPSIKICQTDKNLGLCVLDIVDYNEMVLVHLRDRLHYLYVDHISGNLWNSILTGILNHHIYLLRAFSGLFKKTKKFKDILNFIKDSKSQLPKFHVLPKLHKNKVPIPTRPIVGAVNWISTRWAIFLCSILEKVHVEFALKNSFSLIQKLENSPISDSEFFISADVSSLYTFMSLDRLYSCLQSCNIHPFFIEILKFICNTNFFQYGSNVFKQIDGIAMGFNAAVHCANIYLDSFDKHFAPRFSSYHRYIDDVFMVFQGSESDLLEIFTEMNLFIPGISLNFEKSISEISFLDLTVFKSDGRIAFKTFQKPLNIYQYLPPFSTHPKACLIGFIRGEITRFIRTNTHPSDRFFIIRRFYERLVARGYSKKFLNRIFSSISYVQRFPVASLLSPSIIPLVIPFYPNSITRNFRSFFKLLNSEQCLLYPSKIRFLLAFKRCPNLLQLCSQSNITISQEEHLQRLQGRHRRRPREEGQLPAQGRRVQRRL